ncbi:MAG TPA: hypothetical protein VJ831_00850 [Jatrophihabitantaceae bacterium]|nr:hypothetical protein [Jatrophihabitantaceae bacterium]
MLILGILFVLASGGTAAAIGWQNRDLDVSLNVGSYVWTGPLYVVLAAGALLACWFMLGAAFVQCRLAERLRARRATRDAAGVTETKRQRKASELVRRRQGLTLRTR